MGTRIETLSSRLSRVLASLPPAQRAAILEIDILGRSANEACTKMGISSRTLERRLALGRNQVSAQMGKPQ